MKKRKKGSSKSFFSSKDDVACKWFFKKTEKCGLKLVSFFLLGLSLEKQVFWVLALGRELIVRTTCARKKKPEFFGIRVS